MLRYRSTSKTLPKALAEVMMLPEFVALLGSDRVPGEALAWTINSAAAPGSRTRPGLLLAGDAGSFAHPLSGEGIAWALATGRLAGQVAAEALKSGSVDSVVAEFERRWRQLLGPGIRAASSAGPRALALAVFGSR